MDLRLRGKVALVAAASKGIGRATAKLLIEEGARVSICARSEEGLAAAVTELRDVHTCVADVSSACDLENWVAAARAALGPIDIVVTNTGGPPAGDVGAMTDEQWLSGVESTLMNVVRLTRLVEDDLRASSQGRLVHVTSLVARQPNDLLPISSTLRAGLLGLTRIQANAFAAFGVTVNLVLPGHTLTDRQVHLAEIRAEREGISLEDALKLQAKSVPLGRLAEANEIAAAIVFLCSSSAGYITGQSLVVDGGVVRGI